MKNFIKDYKWDIIALVTTGVLGAIGAVWFNDKFDM